MECTCVKITSKHFTHEKIKKKMNMLDLLKDSREDRFFEKASVGNQQLRINENDMRL